MFRNYFKTAWRNIVRSKGYSALNIFGLAIGMSVALLIGLWMYYQYSFDRFLPNYERLYQVRRNFWSNGDTLTFSTTSLKLANTLKTQVPEIEYVAESDWMGPHGLTVGDKKFYMRGAQIGDNFLKMFEYPMVAGNRATAMSDPYSIVITQSTANALFGNEDALNKTIRYDNKDNLKVTGIIKDLPGNSSLQFAFLVPWTYVEQTNTNIKNNQGSYGNNGYQIFIKTKPGVSYSQVAAKIRNIEHTEKDNTNAMYSYVIMQPISDWHLFSEYKNGKAVEGMIAYVKMFGIIGALVLLIACINFINLTTARSEKRAREVGVRKAIGSERKDLIFQFLMESVMLTVLAFAISLLLVEVALPYFNTLTDSKIEMPFASIGFWLIMLVCIIVTALVAGSRPAFYLSSFQPVKVLKGTLNIGKAGTLPRKILVVLQFSCSIALIISTIIIYQQIQHAKDRPSGYDLNRLLITDAKGDLNKNYTALKNELLQMGIVSSMTFASSPATDIYWHTDLDFWEGKNAGETVEMGAVVIGEDYFKTLGMKFVEGRDFVNNNDTTSVIFNQAAIKRLRIKNPINQIIGWNDKKFKIVGVTNDALMISAFSSADPTMFLTTPDTQYELLYRLSPKIKTQEALTQLNGIFNKYNPGYPYKFDFSDENYARKFNMEMLIGKLSGLFAGLAIFISCLGLFGLAAYIAEQRTKEIGIRKVLGSSVSQVWLLLSKDFIFLVLISCFIASPIAFYFLNQWLLKYDYRIGIGPLVFVLAAAIAVVITLVTISFQAIKAALANPVRSLRSE
ncbi:MAG: ABC transporter permease [Bacteroidetes bacterium]|nr:MAG: ABC transporter permease [Bacteroidota bacterium]